MQSILVISSAHSLITPWAYTLMGSPALTMYLTTFYTGDYFQIQYNFHNAGSNSSSVGGNSHHHEKGRGQLTVVGPHYSPTFLWPPYPEGTVFSLILPVRKLRHRDLSFWLFPLLTGSRAWVPTNGMGSKAASSQFFSSCTPQKEPL